MSTSKQVAPRLSRNFAFLDNFQFAFLKTCTNDQLKTVSDIFRNFVDGAIRPPVSLEQKLQVHIQAIRLIARRSKSIIDRRRRLRALPKHIVEEFLNWFVNSISNVEI